MEALGDIQFGQKRESDAFCWSCHRDEPELFCSECVRSFHISPACSRAKKMNAEAMGIWRCPDCIELEKDVDQMQSSGMQLTRLNELLKCVADLLQADEYLAVRFLDVLYYDTKGKVFNPLDLTKIGEKTEGGEYICIEDFWSDIKWIVHNTKVHRSGDELAVKATKWLLKFTKDELYTIRLCHECYWNANQKRDDWFTKPCTMPHILIWAKQKGFPHWPAKLMAVDVAKHTVDVQFFGDHKRIVLTPKDCCIYSETCPSTNIGLLKEKFKKAVDEAKIYIQNIIMKFGSFHFANSTNLMLNEQHLDRHLYEMVPNAWKNPIVPPEIPPKPARSTNTRRKTVVTRKSAPNMPVPIFGGILTRRMSVAIDAICPSVFEDDTEYKAFDQQSNDTKTLKLKIQPVPKATATFSTSKFLNQQKAKSALCGFSFVGGKIEGISNFSSTNRPNPLVSLAKKRKVSNESDVPKTEGTKKDTTGHQTKVSTQFGTASKLSVQNSPTSLATSVKKNRVFKLPTLPCVRKSSVKPCTYIPIADIPFVGKPIAKMPTLPRPSLNEVPSSVELQVKKEMLSSLEQHDTMDDFDFPPNDDAKLMSPPLPKIFQSHAPEMVALCNAMIEKNTRKVSECIRSSFESSFADFMEAANPAQQIQMLQDQLKALKGQHETLISKNNQMIKQNNEFIQSLTKLKGENEKLIGDLKCELAKNANLNCNLNALSTKNTQLASTVAKLQEINVEQANNLKSAEENNSYLAGANKALMESTEKLKTQLENMTLDNKIQRDQIKEETNKFDVAKAKTYEECVKMIAETKKKQWCATCGMPGGRFYCSPQCEDYYWQQQRN
ncbi:uncharacterized protein LOC129568114 [Sitodiplosis mosellana]|uniref:uncharacterized protein LOC129568114 n=1 Tax=Sitodiplosis mosellana TaxID=263140 RepID=UPI0024449DA0|nr:uncharacterized protein LOC129568114 [Sitodiplosis mosellana]